ncbi:MAG: hypothetical protein PHQ12_14990 [Chthoniobacteraceae bacterium]|nr:hypothetical protein [Chthoniobacteraceae bacterium]
MQKRFCDFCGRETGKTPIRLLDVPTYLPRKKFEVVQIDAVAVNTPCGAIMLDICPNCLTALAMDAERKSNITLKP